MLLTPAATSRSHTACAAAAGVAITPIGVHELTSHGHEVLIEQSVIGWKEYELEVMRDGKDNAVGQAAHPVHGHPGGGVDGLCHFEGRGRPASVVSSADLNARAGNEIVVGVHGW